MKQSTQVYTRALKKYAFLDRDGTLIFEPQDTYQVDTVKQLRILDGVIKGLTWLIKQGYLPVMVTNQDGLGTAGYPLSAFEAVQNKLMNLLNTKGIFFSYVFICPHLPEARCNCRKPKLGLVEKIISGSAMDKTASFVCGDRMSDKQFAKNMGIRFIPMKTNGNFYAALENIV
jgi:imidazoleglycerol-phosphate dehydratase / histidinol-phosphatase